MKKIKKKKTGVNLLVFTLPRFKLDPFALKILSEFIHYHCTKKTIITQIYNLVFEQ
jgi:hypothetical protein